LRIVAVGRNGDGAARASVWSRPRSSGFAQRLTLDNRGKRHCGSLPLVGEFQIEERAGPRRPCDRTGSEPKAVFTELELLEGAKGRLERVAERNGAPIFRRLRAPSPTRWRRRCRRCGLTPTKIVVVFGAGGDRDAGKRPLMGAIAV